MSLRIGLFTIASKNYLSYVRALMDSVERHNPTYARYLFLADEIEGRFAPNEESFRIVPARDLEIQSFWDMVLRYDVMELNTAIKPYAFQWLLKNSNLDAIIYLDPDIRAYDRFSRLEAVIGKGPSVVFTPHISRPVEDEFNPNDYHMLQSGVFNLGFAAITRCEEARMFVDWWARRLATQGIASFADNLFTDQRWCDLAPCFLDRLHVFKDPGYNVAYWNLKERSIWPKGSSWMVNDLPLAFFHFSGIDVAGSEQISKHQNRFSWEDLKGIQGLFSDYREQVLMKGWRETRPLRYAYDFLAEDVRLTPIVRRTYRRFNPGSRPLREGDTLAAIREACLEPSPFIPDDRQNRITKLMETVYRERPDLQVAFNLQTAIGRRGFCNWFCSAAAREYKLDEFFIPDVVPFLPSPSCDVARDPAGDQLACDNDTQGESEGRSEAHLPAWTALTQLWGRTTWPQRHHLARPVLAAILASDLSRNVANKPVVEKESVSKDSLRASEPTSEASRGRPRRQKIETLQDAANIDQLVPDRTITNLLYMIWRSRRDLQIAFDLYTAAGQSSYLGWCDVSIEREFGISVLSVGSDFQADGEGVDSAPAAKTLPALPGANLIGYATAELGMGEHVRMQAAALHSTDVPFGVFNFKAGVASRQLATLQRGREITSNPYSTNIFNINADQMLLVLSTLGMNFFRDRYNIGYWAWELSECPEDFVPAMQLVDEIWAGSRFVHESFASRSTVPVLYMPECVELPRFKRLGKARFGIEEGCFSFLYTFDFFSFMERKNPLAAIRAFRMAFSSDLRVRLVLKVMNGNEVSPAWKAMIEEIGGDRRVIVINETMSRAEVLALFDACDCYVSLHRSEGFGRGPAEAMLLGKPVIATNYSGNLDYMTEVNSCLVNYELVPVREGDYPFWERQVWAAADESHASWFMKKVVSDPSYAMSLGARAKADIGAHFCAKVIGRRYSERLRRLKLA